MDVEALLARIGLDARPAPTVEGLRRVHRAYVSSVPYEDLTVQLGAFAPLDVDALCARLLSGGRGGPCFEVNGVLAALLSDLGFAVTMHESLVDERDSGAPTNHLGLSVVAEGRTFLAEAGWGEGWLEPLAMDTAAKSVTMDGRAVELTAFEYKVLEYLVMHAGEVVSKTALTEHLYREDEERDSNVIE